MSSPFDELSARLRASEPYRRLLAGSTRAERLPVPAAAWVVDLLAGDLGGTPLVLVPRESDALAWCEAAELFGAGARFFPAPSLTPYQEADVSVGVRAREAAAIDRLLGGSARALVCTPRALARRLPSARSWSESVVELAVGDEMPLEGLALALSARGYRRVELVTEVGDLALRGGVFDCFPPGEDLPLRLDFFGDTVDSIQRFDVEDQRSRESIERARLLPLALFPEGPEHMPALGRALREAAGAALTLPAAQRIEELEGGRPFPGWQRHLVLLAEETVGIEDLLTDPWCVAVDPRALSEEMEHYWAQLVEEAAARRRQGLLAAAPELLERPVGEGLALIAGARVVVDGEGGGGADFGGQPTDLFHGQLPRFPREIETARRRAESPILVAPEEQHRWLADWLRGVEGGDAVRLVDGELRRGFRLPAAAAVLFGEPQLFPRRVARPGRSRAVRAFLAGLEELRQGDFVVHRDHGIGQFRELRAVSGAPDGAGGEVEVMEIEYSDGRRLLLPLSRLDLIERYSGLEAVAPRLDKLGGSSWSRTKDRVKRGMRRLAGDLLKLYAERQVAEAPALPPPGDLQAQFEASFEHEETVDQEAAVRAIHEDLSKGRPMDRLLCGDVGFGKTEVAMRAAFRVVEGGYQVAVLAPTTILADQHLQTFRDRFAGFPVHIEMVSRLVPPAEVKDIRQRVAAGAVDILIGTHRLLSRDIDLPRLGLLVVDEEQRFGVAQKERLKELKRSVHVLSMSATPVPRTLQLSLAGVRDLSLIETPPRDRMAVETAILPMGAELVREAVGFELERGGQVYFVHNRVEDIERVATWLRETLPDVRLTLGHGQLPERELVERMHAFKAGEYDLLLATTIIENGIDIPNVNTMIIHRADRFGLAQLYQLRGRVGRGRQLAFCYLTVPGDRVLSADARQRLEAIREFTELGAGFRVAARDLEIRGAGNLLGAEQSGHIAAVGIETYMRMLEETVRELSGEAPAERPSAVLDLPVAMAIPPDYVADPNLRMGLYRRIADGDEEEADLLAELRDRFGAPPEAVRQLVAGARLKRRAEEIGVQSVSFRSGALQLRLRQDNRIDLDHLVDWLGRREDASFSPSGVLTLGGVPAGEVLPRALALLADLSP
jgi:transcription-repair coupling factor (superfamily II helicase)